MAAVRDPSRGEGRIENLAADGLLSLRGVTKSFGGLRAVDGVSFDVRPGEIVALIGPNGAGKTTLFSIVAGELAPDAGDVRFDGERIAGLPPHRIAARGLVRTFQTPREFGSLTVLENVVLAAPGHPGETLGGLLRPRRWKAFEREVRTRATELLETTGLAGVAELPAHELSGGQKKLLELSRALMAKPRMVLLDEPVAGVNPALAATILDRLEQLRREGLTFLLVEHDMEVVLRRCDRVVAMHEGRKLVEGTPEEVRADPRLLESYLGG
ncbi:MAG TPA: ABC transporter ATP-binding protein [Candidatus Thermoplasmatota archaeon]|nr:ABC transporter ATP-binding protein [Candidatus Thermoplasmatota archaeon]